MRMVARQWRVAAPCLAVVVFLLLVDSTFEQLLLNSKAERLGLLQLRSSLGLRAKQWPIKADPCLGWVGVNCRNGRVVGINISGFKRTRIGSKNPRFSVDSLQNFSRLTYFNASFFMLPGSIPGWFGLRMSSLRVLDLTSCSIIGSLPTSLGNLSSLTQLHLSHNGLTGVIPLSLGQLSSLSVLNLSHNALNGSIPQSFGSLGSLTLLDLSVNSLFGSIPLGIGTLSRLKFLNLSGNNLSSSIPPQLGDLSSLTDLDLSFNSLAGNVPPDLSGLRSLRRLVMENNMLSGFLPANLFAPLTQLQFLALGHNNFSGDFPDALWSMPELQFLDASVNNFTGSLPNLTSNAIATTTAVFNLSQNTFYGYLTTAILRFSFLDLSGNYFEGKVPDYVHSNVSLSTNCLQNVSSQRLFGECDSFYTGRGLKFDTGQPNATEPPPPPPPPPRSKKSRRNVIILAGVLGGVGLIALLGILLLTMMICRRKRSTPNQRGTGVGPVPTGSTPPPPGLSLNLSSLGDSFTFQQILQATGDFNDENFIKHGHSGDLFRGLLEGGIPVVIKRIDLQSVKKETYTLELEFFSKVSHPRIVPLLGHCLENENQKFLVYKYMPNGDLSSSLFKKNDSDDDSLQSLDWITRLKIAIGAAEVLSYLHHECSPALVHRDVQSSSVLLDDKFEVRLGSLSEVCTQEADTPHNRFSRFLRLQQTSDQASSGSHPTICSYDVYCFGKVLLELVTGRIGFSASDDSSMKEWLDRTLPYISIYDKELVTKIVDPSLIIDEDLLEEVWAMAIVARSCLNPKPSRRPLMRYILKALENPLKVVREDHTGSARLKATSSRGSWNAGLFGSWRQSSSDVAAVPVVPSSKAEGTSGFKHSGTSGSQGSGQIGEGGGGNSSSTRRSKEIFPEPMSEI
ncbi:PREDICTED: probable LRR receptor-like serine/threonine-protein kinase At2g16250 [Ipomoea nil]|uniref:probable LRR receptor-like serine/threonine-protein kinase At2g16250 n=1 Tax=Ipomoea nil TaxID=35883 RepID=UPI00090179FB|nr:PREDICTED: probable LRR receptor-like serine/threonine-protein kinase At2g16250 [Ipomoea nil]